jgi:metal-responsive CopG/Arc/MetJ family transcriptional regulator
MSTLCRAQILLETEQHQTLTEMAEREGQSPSDLIREVVREYLAERDKQRRLQREMQALEALVRIRKQAEAQHGVYHGDLLAEAREERGQDVERVWMEE